MKSFVAFVIFGVLAAATALPFTEEQLHKGREHVKKCIAETKIDAAVVQQLKQGDFSNQDEKTQCFALCFFREAGFTDAEGNQNENVIVSKLSVDKDRAQVQAVFDKCKSIEGSSPCNKAFNAYKCYRSAVQF